MLRMFLKHLTKLPCCRQPTPWSCGATALLSCARYHGNRAITFRELIQATATSEQGTSLTLLERAARETLALQTSLLSADDSTALKEFADPAIIPIRNSAGRPHFVVVYRAVSDTTLLIADPAQGLVRMALADLNARWSGEVLLLGPPARQRRLRLPGWLKFVFEVYSHCPLAAGRAALILSAVSITAAGALLALRWLIVAALNGGLSLLLPAVVSLSVSLSRFLLTRASGRNMQKLRKLIGTELQQVWQRANSSRARSAGHRPSLKHGLRSARQLLGVRESLLALLWTVSDSLVIAVCLILIVELGSGVALIMAGAFAALFLSGHRSGHSDQSDEVGCRAAGTQLITDVTSTTAMYWLGLQLQAGGVQVFGLVSLLLIVAVVRQPLIRVAALPRHAACITRFLNEIRLPKTHPV